MDFVTKVVAAINAAHIDCGAEYGTARLEKKRGQIHAYAGIKKVRLERLRAGVSDVTAQVRVTVQAFGADGSAVRSAAEEKVIPAVMGCDEEIYSAEISETYYDIKTDRVYCEIIFEVRRGGYDICVG